MKSKTLPSFWKHYEKLEEEIWSLRITKGYRALCLYEKDLVVWFWIGNHDDYERLIKKK